MRKVHIMRKKYFKAKLTANLVKIGLIATKEKAKTFPTDFEICFCSPLKRAKKTAEILVPYLDIKFDKRLMERGVGDWENTPLTDEKLKQLSEGIVPPNGETYKQIEKRVLAFLNMIKNNYSKEKVLVVTHGGVINTIYKILGLEVKTIDNIEMVTIEF